MSDFQIIEQHTKHINKIACYQKLGGKHTKALMRTVAEIPFVQGLSILDVGCNNGLHSLIASKYCPSVIGVEVEHYLYESAMEMKEYFQKNIKGYNPDGVQFLNCPISELKGTFEGVLAFNILYHLDKSNLRRMTEIIDGSSRIIVQARKKVTKKSAKNNLHQPDKITLYLEKMGFSCTTKMRESARPIIVGEKRNGG